MSYLDSHELFQGHLIYSGLQIYSINLGGKIRKTFIEQISYDCEKLGAVYMLAFIA